MHLTRRMLLVSQCARGAQTLQLRRTRCVCVRGLLEWASKKSNGRSLHSAPQPSSNCGARNDIVVNFCTQLACKTNLLLLLLLQRRFRSAAATPPPSPVSELFFVRQKWNREKVKENSSNTCASTKCIVFIPSR